MTAPSCEFTSDGVKDVDPFAIAAILGHANIRMTASYAHATQQSKRAAVAAVESKTEKLGHNVGHISERLEKLAVGK